jgi:hypothetical protein
VPLTLNLIDYGMSMAVTDNIREEEEELLAMCCCESMVVRVHSALRSHAMKLVAWSATARVRAELVSCRQPASLGCVQLRS